MGDSPIICPVLGIAPPAGMVYNLRHGVSLRRLVDPSQASFQFTMIPQPPPGQGPIDPRGAFTPPPPPGVSGRAAGIRGATAIVWRSGRADDAATGDVSAGADVSAPDDDAAAGVLPAAAEFRAAIFTTLATAVLGLSITLNVYLLVFSNLGGVFGGGSQGITETVLVDGSLDEKIAVIPVTG